MDMTKHDYKQVMMNLSRRDIEHFEFLLFGHWDNVREDYATYLDNRLHAISQIKGVWDEVLLQWFNEEIEVVVKKQ